MSKGHSILYDIGEYLAENLLSEGLKKLLAGHFEALGVAGIVAVAAIAAVVPILIMQAVWLPPEADPRDTWDRQMDKLDPDDEALMRSLFERPLIVEDLAHKTNHRAAQTVEEFTDQVRQLLAARVHGSN